MKARQIEDSIRTSIALNTPDLFDKIASTPIQKLPEEDYIVRELPTTRKIFSPLHKIYALCSSVAMILMICFGFLHNYNTVESIIAIDVNPSVEISLNKSYKVLSVRANNMDGEKLIENKNFKNQNCDDVIAELTTSLSSNGYINKDRNSILVSVSSPNEVKAAEVKSRVVTDIKTTLHKQQIDPVIYNQSIPDKDTNELDKLAKKYHISFGKMKLIHSLMEKDPTLTIKELAELPIQDIPTYVEERQIKLADVIDCDHQVQVADTEVKQEEKKVIPRSETTTDVATSETSTVSTEVITTTTTTSSTSILQQEDKAHTESISKNNTEKATEVVGIAAKKPCNNCDNSCTCSNCTSENGCADNCDKCSSSCSNATNSSTDTPSTNTSTTTPSTTGTTDTNKKPNKEDNTESGYEILDPDDLESSGSESELEPTTSATKEEDDLTSSGTMDFESSSTEIIDNIEKIEE